MENEIWKDIPGYEGYYQISMCSRGLLKTSGGYIWKKGGSK